MIKSFSTPLEDVVPLNSGENEEYAFAIASSSVGESTILSYDSSFSSSENDFFLLKVPSELENTLLNFDSDFTSPKRKKSNRGDISESIPHFQFRSNPVSNSSVLVTEDSTYSVVSVETTNTLLLIPPQSNRIITHLSDTIELHRISPPTHLLHNLLTKTAWKFDDIYSKETSQNSQNSLFSLSQIYSLIPCSRIEINRAIDQYGAFLLNGYLRVIEIDTLSKISKNLLEFVRSLHTLELDSKTIFNFLSDKYPIEVAEYILQRFFIPKSSDDHVDSDSTQLLHSKSSFDVSEAFLLTLNKPAFLRAYALPILLQKPKMSQSNFEQILFSETKFAVHPHDLLGICIFHNNSVEFLYEPFLDHNLQKRLNILFSSKKWWTLEEITPYLSNLLPPAKDLEQFLGSICRSYFDNERLEKLYGTKHNLSS